MFYVLNWNISLKVVKLNYGREMSVKKHYMDPLHGVPGHYRPAQPIQVECMSSLCSLWFLGCFNSKLSGLTFTLQEIKD